MDHEQKWALWLKYGKEKKIKNYVTPLDHIIRKIGIKVAPQMFWPLKKMIIGYSIAGFILFFGGMLQDPHNRTGVFLVGLFIYSIPVGVVMGIILSFFVHYQNMRDRQKYQIVDWNKIFEEENAN